MAKRLRTSLVQREILFAFMHAHEDFARNQLAGPNAEKIKQVLLKQLTQQLNSTGTGVVKSPDKWLKCWQDWKADVKGKYSRIKTFENTKFNKDEVLVPRPLSELEEKLLQFLNIDVVEEDLNERQKRVSFSQRELMLEIMEAHKEVALNLLLGSDRTENKKVLLNELAEELNAMGPAIKSSERWFKCWQDWKSDVKAKDLKIKIFNQKKAITDDDVSPPCPLSYLEEKLLKFLDVDNVEFKVKVVNEAEVLKDKRVSLAQREMMFAFMQAHEEFGKNQIRGLNATKMKKVLLYKLTKQLNASGPATKSPEKWLRCWQDWKSDTKAKWQKLNNFKQTEAIMHDYVRSPCPLTPMEQKVVDFFGFGKIECADESEKMERRRRQPLLKNRAYKEYSTEMLEAAVDLVSRKEISSREAEKRFHIPRRTIENKVKNKHSRKPGGQQKLSDTEEENIVNVLRVAGDFGAPLSSFDLSLVVFNYLKGNNREYIFNKKPPGKCWIKNFLVRHKDKLSITVTQNLKRVRAAKTSDEFNIYLDHLRNTLQDISKSNILNYDETNLSDNPESSKCIFKREVKYPERVLNHTKGNISIMFAAVADGTLLPTYTVYKAEHLWTSWCQNGPNGARYNRTKSGWFDATAFQDWFQKIVIPWAEKLEGPKLIIGDNLSSYLNVNIIRLCEETNIRFAFLPPKSTHITQPLDVAFFGPLKTQWRKILTTYKHENPLETQLNKTHFPVLLKSLIQAIAINSKENVISGFRATGIVPFNPHKILRKLPDHEQETEYTVDNALLDYLKETRSVIPIRKIKNKIVNITPGASVSSEEIEMDTWQDKKSIMKKRALTNPEQAADFPALLLPTQTNMTVPEAETPAPGPSSTQESGVNIEDIFQASGSTIKVELDNLDTSDSDDPLNFEEEYLVSDPASPEPEPEPEIEQPRNTARDRSRRRFRRVFRRPLTHSRLDVINHITVNEVKKALIQKNEIKKQFYAQYLEEIRKQTQALVSIAKRLANNR